MEGGLFDAVVYWHWLALAAAFVALEIVVPGVFPDFPWHCIGYGRCRALGYSQGWIGACSW